MANANIFQTYLQPVRSMQDYAADLDKRDATKLGLENMRSNNALLNITRAQQADAAQQQIAERNALQRVASTWSSNTTPDQRAASLRATGMPGLAQQADAIEKQWVDRRKVESDIGKTSADTDKAKLEAITARLEMSKRFLDTVTTPDQYMEWHRANHTDPVLGPLLAQRGVTEETARASIDQAMREPGGFQKLLQKSAMGLQKFTELAQTKLIADEGNATQVKTTGMNNATSRANNAATVGASYANAAAVASTGAAVRDAAKISSDRATEMKLADDYRSQSKDFGDVRSAYSQISAALDSSTTSAAATLAAATKFMKMIDPGSVVRESELGMALAATGVLDRAENYMNTLKHGKVLTASQAADFKKISAKIYGAAKSVQRDIDTDYKKKATTYNLRPEMVVQDLGQNSTVLRFDAAGNPVK